MNVSLSFRLRAKRFVFPLQYKGSSSVDILLSETSLLRAVCPQTREAKKTGLLNHASLGESEALLLRNVRRVHSYGMHFDIGVAFLSAGNVVLAVEELKSNSWLGGPADTAHVLEFHREKIPSLKVLRGLTLVLLAQECAD